MTRLEVMEKTSWDIVGNREEFPLKTLDPLADGKQGTRTSPRERSKDIAVGKTQQYGYKSRYHQEDCT